jgi:Holliday junction resolvasome RuvABC endonuclease subunit
MILGIDPGLHLGWAVADSRAAVIAGGTYHLVRNEHHESPGMRWIRVNAFLAFLLTHFHITQVAYEAFFFQKSGAASTAYNGVVTRLWEQCDRHGIEYEGHKPADVKKFATGNGSAGKDLMITAAKRRWPEVAIEDDNQADAMWIAALTAHQLRHPLG